MRLSFLIFLAFWCITGIENSTAIVGTDSFLISSETISGKVIAEFGYEAGGYVEADIQLLHHEDIPNRQFEIFLVLCGRGGMDAALRLGLQEETCMEQMPQTGCNFWVVDSNYHYIFEYVHQTQKYYFGVVSCSLDPVTVERVTYRLVNPYGEHLSTGQKPLPTMYMSVLLMWLAQCMLQAANVLCFKRLVTTLHKANFLVPAFKMIHLAVTVLYWQRMSTTGLEDPILAAQVAVLAVNAKCAMFASILVLAKGWFITRRRIPPNERHAMIMSVSFFMFLLACSSLLVAFSLFALVMLYMVVLVLVVTAISRNIRLLRHQVFTLHPHLLALEPSLLLKARLFRTLQVTMFIYFGVRVLLEMLALILGEVPWVAMFLEESADVLLWATITYTFRLQTPNPFGFAHQALIPPARFFTDQAGQHSGMTSERTHPPTLLEATLPEDPRAQRSPQHQHAEHQHSLGPNTHSQVMHRHEQMVVIENPSPEDEEERIMNVSLGVPDIPGEMSFGRSRLRVKPPTPPMMFPSSVHNLGGGGGGHEEDLMTRHLQETLGDDIDEFILEDLEVAHSARMLELMRTNMQTRTRTSPAGAPGGGQGAAGGGGTWAVSQPQQSPAQHRDRPRSTEAWDSNIAPQTSLERARARLRTDPPLQYQRSPRRPRLTEEPQVLVVDSSAHSRSHSPLSDPLRGVSRLGATVSSHSTAATLEQQGTGVIGSLASSQASLPPGMVVAEDQHGVASQDSVSRITSQVLSASGTIQEIEQSGPSNSVFAYRSNPSVTHSAAAPAMLVGDDVADDVSEADIDLDVPLATRRQAPPAGSAPGPPASAFGPSSSGTSSNLVAAATESPSLSTTTTTSPSSALNPPRRGGFFQQIIDWNRNMFGMLPATSGVSQAPHPSPPPPPLSSGGGGENVFPLTPPPPPPVIAAVVAESSPQDSENILERLASAGRAGSVEGTAWRAAEHSISDLRSSHYLSTYQGSDYQASEVVDEVLPFSQNMARLGSLEEHQQIQRYDG